MLLGWAWGAACMAAALSVQDKSLLAARLAAAQKGLVPNISPTLQLQSLTFHGAFLDARSSAVYGAMFFVGTFGMGVLRARMPKLALMGIFGTIVMDVVCSTGPCACFFLCFLFRLRVPTSSYPWRSHGIERASERFALLYSSRRFASPPLYSVYSFSNFHLPLLLPPPQLSSFLPSPPVSPFFFLNHINLSLAPSLFLRQLL
jgi:hypothetical protein